MSDAAHQALRERVLSGQASADEALVFADSCFERDDNEGAAAALDRAYGLRPEDARIAEQRAQLLDSLAVEAHGLRFRYVPAGTVLLGSADGDFDEQPVHARRLEPFYLAELPISWADFCRLLDWHPPPAGRPKDEAALDCDDPRYASFCLNQINKVRLQYCESATTQAVDWHAHLGSETFGEAPRQNGAPQRHSYDRKPIVAVDYPDALAVAAKLTAAGDAIYRLASEAEWERAARGGLIGARYGWGDEPPTRARLDFDNFGAFHIADPRRYPPNGYGLYGMCGSVWEWTSDRYDALGYARAAGARVDHSAAAQPDAPRQRVLRGGSWADCAAACTVSFRSSADEGSSWLAARGQRSGPAENPNIGMRLLRQAATIER